MSKFIPDPQIQSLRAMRAGDIAFGLPSPVTQTIGVAPQAALSPEAQKSVSPAAALTTEALSGTPSEAANVGVADATAVSDDTAQSISISAVDTLESVTFPAGEAPMVGVATGTSVV